MNFPGTKAPIQGFLALVSYIPEPLGPFLDQLRQSLPGLDFPRSHVTLLPPRPLRVGADVASRQARAVLDRFPAFEIELSTVRLFPETNVLYLDLRKGNQTVQQVHDALATGNLHHEEQFEFHPHVTLAGPIPQPAMASIREKAERAWQSFAENRRFFVDEVIALWADGQDDSPEWQRLWSHALRVGRARTASAGPTGRRS